MCRYNDVCLLSTERRAEPGGISTMFRGKTKDDLVKSLNESGRMIRGEIRGAD